MTQNKVPTEVERVNAKVWATPVRSEIESRYCI